MKPYLFFVLFVFPILTMAATTNTTKKTDLTTFPYSAAPSGNVCVKQPSGHYATPESMLGSWAMVDAIAMDQSAGHLPKFMNQNNTVYAVGTAAVGQLLGLQNCSGGCDNLNGYCFALKFTNKTSGPNYMIFQSVNIGANPYSFDIYMAGGGSGAFSGHCTSFWGQNVANWANHIESSSCDQYFNFNNITSKYQVTYNGITHNAKDTLKNACNVASSTGFNKQNWTNVIAIPVTCPIYLTQVSGIQLSSQYQASIGNSKIMPITQLKDNNFTQPVKGVKSLQVSTTQMQDCEAPSSSYCNKPNEQHSVPNYNASITASGTAPILRPSQ